MALLHCNAYVCVHAAVITRGTLIYVLLDDRKAFDLIDLPEEGNEKVRHKVLESGGQHLVFQFWLEKP